VNGAVDLGLERVPASFDKLRMGRIVDAASVWGVPNAPHPEPVEGHRTLVQADCNLNTLRVLPPLLPLRVLPPLLPLRGCPPPRGGRTKGTS
jgi:hypothetical protein